jgi:2-polyprenyl-6-hydroxyphenyl methylase/3-demethylubiquinone-9 3-methyltransferase
LSSQPGLPSSWFDFGRNWVEFSRRAITPEKVHQAREEFQQLLAGIDLRGRWFLDIGFGQGLSLLAAAEMGARAVGCDINARCLQALQASAAHFPTVRTELVDVVVGSILEPPVVEQLRSRTPGSLGYHVVHSWGVLHHTGDLWSALAVAGSLVREGGHLVAAIYNRHITSPAWVWVKRLYNTSPRWVRRGMILFFYPLILLSKRIVTGKNPHLQERGMDFYYNVVDWIGGYPYESALPEEVIRRAASLGLTCVRSRPAGVPTGCNEFVFKRA